VTWTYDPTALATTALFQLRWLIGDTLVKDPQMQDEELIWAISQRTSVYGAAADACNAIAARMSREADSTQGPAHTLYSSRARSYRAQAGTFEVKAMARSAGLPYGGQMSVADYELMTSDPDRIGGQFVIGMDDNFIPVGPVGNESAVDEAIAEGGIS
jgi:hypothetical protein